MADAISGANQYTGSSNRTQGSSSAGNTYDAVFTNKKDNSLLDPSEFLNLMIAQMQNQDFMNPMDDTAYVTQMAQFSNMQQMQQMAEYSRTSYALSLVGKTATASRFTVSGDLDTTTGVVDKVSLINNEYLLSIGGKTYDLSQIMSVGGTQDKNKPQAEANQYALEKKEVTANSVSLQWPVPTEDKAISDGLKYTVYYTDNGPFDTLEAVEAGTKYGGPQKGITEETVKNLQPDTTYYFNVVIEDTNGNKTVYKPISVKTLTQ